jgi:hypothetical protein
MKKIVLSLVVLLGPYLGFALELKGNWVLEKSDISYTVSHPLHVVHGKSLSARGKGVCYGNHCEFLVAVPVNTFDSGDHNRDAHMWEVTRAGLYPLIQVRAKTGGKDGAAAPKQLLADLEVQFNGHTKTYNKVPLDVLEWKTDEVHVSGTIPLTLKDFEITPPSLLTMPIRNDVPVKLDTVWKRAGSK